MLEPAKSPVVNRTSHRRLNAKQFTIDAARETSKVILRTRLQLVDRAMRATKVKQAGGIIFLGVPGWVEELRIAASVVSTVINRYVDAWDSFVELDDSILGDRAGPAPHRLTPPTIHGRVLVHGGAWPDLRDEIHPLNFVCLARDYWEPLKAIRRDLLNDTVLIGRHEILRDLAEERGLSYGVIAHFEDYFAVRAGL